ncbi:MAG: hypothetical protein K2H86_05790 [Muribaculaceae bacterium]|nr:hypothetical protein [Muribaculaceae bacterium]
MHLRLSPETISGLKSDCRTYKAIGLCALFLTVSASMMMTSCRKYDGSKAADNRQSWIKSLNDSISVLTELNTINADSINRLRAEVSSQLNDFTTIDNPREVEPYYIYSPFKSGYPLTSTGVAVRILKNESLEVVAAATRPFTAISVRGGGASYTTPVVPPDQALNYTANGLTTVSFTGSVADSITDIIATAGKRTSVEYLNPGVVASYSVTPEIERLFKSTNTLYDNQQRLHRLEQAVSINARKIELLKITLHNQN